MINKCTNCFADYWQQLTYLVTHSKEQSHSWEATHFSATQEIPHILGNLEVNYHTHKWPPHAPIMNQLNPIHTPTNYFLMTMATADWLISTLVTLPITN